MTNGFPSGFTWGAATASYQVEGAVSADGRGPSIWDTFAHTPGRIADGTNGDVADDHYHRFADDIRLLAGLGLNAYRFSIAWPRIMPGGAVNTAGLDFYRRLAEKCLEYGVTPYATLYHWDLPQPLEDAGGWLVRDTAERFRDYAAATHDALSDVVKHWMTLNEPWCSAFLGYGNGEHAPGRTEGADALKAVHHLLLGHGLALDAIRPQGSAGSAYGIALNPAPIHAATDSAADRDAARRIDGLRNRLFLEPLLSGRYPADVLEDTGMAEWFAAQEADLPLIGAPLDFIGVNYYCPTTVAAPDGPISSPGASTQPGSENVVAVDTGLPKTQMGWPIQATGLRDILVTINKLAPELPLYVTENGSAYPDTVTADGTVEDDERLDYLQQHVAVCKDLVAEGFPLKGYFAWSLLDNFEWAWGYSRRFGIVYVDYATQQRIVKKSGLWLKDFLQ
ncbi:MAG TPA: GH1 family beta-glucosidase [Kribbella sp.]